MNETPDLLSGVDLLLAAARTGSATRAAVQLGTTTATILRRLEVLEATLGARLFDRLPTGLRPTPALALVKPWAEQAEAAATGMLHELSGLESRPIGTVRLAVPPTVASLFVVPELHRLREKYPDITVELAPATAIVDLTMREADLAIRTLRPEKGDLVSQRLASYRIVIVHSPKLMVPRGASFASLPWLGWDRALSHIPEARWLTTHVPQARVVLRSMELGTLLAAAQCGVGLLAVPEVVAERAGGLVRFKAPIPDAPEGAIWLVAHAALRPVARVAAVWDWLSASFDDRRRAPRKVARATR